MLANYNFKKIFRPGKQNGKPNVLTRIVSDRPKEGTDLRNQYQLQTIIKPHQILRRGEITEDIIPAEISLLNWDKHCKEDNYCQEIRSALENPREMRTEIELSNCKLTTHSFTLNGKEYIPELPREIILKQLHESPLYEHRGAAALYYMVNHQYWWPGCHRDATKYA